MIHSSPVRGAKSSNSLGPNESFYILGLKFKAWALILLTLFSLVWVEIKAWAPIGM